MHVLFAGMTMSGKSTLAKMMVQKYKTKNPPTRTIVLDPIQDPDWRADFQTDENDIFLEAMYASRSCALFVDESGSAIGRYGGSMAVVATQSRHLGHKAHFLTQRPSQLDKTIRDQCSVLFLFRVSRSDAKTLYEEFGNEEILESPNFPQGQCLKIERFKTPVILNVFGQPISLKKSEKEIPENESKLQAPENEEEIEE